MRGRRAVLASAALVLGDFLPGSPAARQLSLDDGEKLLACEGLQREVASGCAPVSCDEDCSPVAAEWASWGEWEACGCIGTQERSRVLATAASCGGQDAVGPAAQSRGCTPTCNTAPVDCTFDDWSVWGECTAPCGTGQTTRTRKVLGHKNCGSPCDGDLSDTMACNTEPCEYGIDCAYTPWSPWGSCSATCGNGQQLRFRNISQYNSEDGTGCVGRLEETQGCEEKCCDGMVAVDCTWGDWEEWTICTATCGGGSQYRNRGGLVPASHGGAACPEADVMAFQSCNAEPCEAVVNGVWGDWSDWGAGLDEAGLPKSCSKDCGGGHHYRTRDVLTPPSNGGAPASGAKMEYEACNVQPCDSIQDCIFSEWTEYGKCSKTVNGVQERTRTITQFAENGGSLCVGSLIDVKPCYTPADFPLLDGKAGELSSWTEWGECTVTCDGGSKTRTRTVISEGESVSGKSLKEIVGCNGQPCCPECSVSVDCVWKPWEAWSACPVTCGGGETTRFRDIMTMPKANGKPCTSGDSFEVAVCNAALCHKKEYCVWSAWGAYGECSATCGGGRATRERHLVLSDKPPAVGDSLDETELSEQYKELSAKLTSANLAFGGVAGVVALGTVLSGLWVFSRLKDSDME